MYAEEDSEEETTEQEATGRSTGQQSTRGTSIPKPEQKTAVSTSKQLPSQQQRTQVEPPKTQIFEVPEPTQEIAQVPRIVRTEPDPPQPPPTQIPMPTQPFEVEGENFRVIENFMAEEPGDLDAQRGEILKILAVRPDGWWQARAADGNVGYVPKNVLEHFPEVQAQQQLEPPVEAPTQLPSQPAQTVVPPISEPYRLEAPQEPVQQPSFGAGSTIRGPMPVIVNEQEIVEPQMPEIAQIRTNDHFSLTCHLTPRLSESNLGFHDIYWYYNNRDKAYHIKKRKVRVCKLVKMLAVEKIQKTGNEPEEKFRLSVCLFDKRSSVGRQIVSNIHSMTLKTEIGGLTNFLSKITTSQERGKNFLVRSNYVQKEVVLKIELFHSNGTSLGAIEKVLLDENGKISLPNKTFTEDTTLGNGNAAGNFRIKFQVADVPSNLVMHADSLPDVLIVDETFIQVFAMYRQLVAEALAERETISKSTWICDPVIASFPRAAADIDLMLMFHYELTRKKALQKNDLKEFRFVYERYVLPICDGALLPQNPEAKRQYLEQFRARVETDKDDPVGFLCSQQFRPLTMKEYALDLCGEHALD
uniref:SH3 domain-containing protein n=1 Tax=Acrobeloides nanus TaxID=290746 RepID=A0A914CNZ9_9BILA